MIFFIILMLEETHVDIRVDCVGTSLPPVCTVPVKHPVVCLCAYGGVLVLPHHDCFFQVHAKRLVGWIFSHEKFNFYVLDICLFLCPCQFQGCCCLESFCFIIFVIFSSSSVVTGLYQALTFICLLIETCTFTFSRYSKGSG